MSRGQAIIESPQKLMSKGSLLRHNDMSHLIQETVLYLPQSESVDLRDDGTSINEDV
jgi:hypothetical protein